MIDELVKTLDKKPETSTDIILKAYQIGRYFGCREHYAYTDPHHYDHLCEFIANLTAELITELNTITQRECAT